MSAFDGAGKPYKGSGFRGPLIVLVVALVAVALIWLAFSSALSTDFGFTITPPPRVEQP
jgi:hypothetical protein